MPKIIVDVYIEAPLARVFQLACSIDVHSDSQSHRGERAIGGRTTGCVVLDDKVTWEATHFGIRQELTSHVVEMKPPYHFKDVMVSGAFHRFEHDHFFESQGSGTLMRDVFDYTSPLSILGRLADWIFLERYMSRFLKQKGAHLKQVAESHAWQDYLGSESESPRDLSV